MLIEQALPAACLDCKSASSCLAGLQVYRPVEAEIVVKVNPSSVQLVRSVGFAVGLEPEAAVELELEAVALAGRNWRCESALLVAAQPDRLQAKLLAAEPDPVSKCQPSIAWLGRFAKRRTLPVCLPSFPTSCHDQSQSTD